MSTAEILSLVSLISYIIAGISLVLAVFFWFAFKIPSVIGDLSGRTARKSIARMRASNEKAGGQGYKPSATNANRGKLTDTMQHSKSRKQILPRRKPNPTVECHKPGCYPLTKLICPVPIKQTCWKIPKPPVYWWMPMRQLRCMMSLLRE